MGNHSDTGELLEEARELATTEKNVSFGDTLLDEFGNVIRLDEPDETKLKNPTRLKDSSGRDVELLQNKASDGKLTPKQFEAMQAKRNKKKAS